MSDAQQALEIYGRLLGELYPGLRATGDAVEHAQSIADQVRQRHASAQTRERAEDARRRLAALHEHIDRLERDLAAAREEAEQWHRKATRSGDERLRAALDERERMQLERDAARARLVAAEDAESMAQGARFDAERELDAARAAIHEAEERGALAVFRAIERAVSMGHVVPVPSDERVWASVAARICAEARAKGGE